MLAHDPFDPLAADGLTLGAQFGVDARRSVSSLVLCMNPPISANRSRLAILRGLSGRDRHA
jgi:hypothetical protein